MPKFTDLLPATKSNPRGVGMDWQPLSRPGTGVLTIKDRREYMSYAVTEFPTDLDGRGFLLAKLDAGGDPEAGGYTVFVGRNGQDRSCECRGFLRWGKPCKHISAVQALIINQWVDCLPMVDPVPVDEVDFATAFGANEVAG